MKRILTFLMIIVSGVAFGQTPAGYTKINSRLDYLAFKADSGSHAPGYAGVPYIRTGIWTGAGNIGVDTVNHRFYYYSGSTWRYAAVGGATGTAWNVGGNTGTSSGVLGTTDAQPLLISTNGVERARVLSGGNIGIGTATPVSKVTISTSAIDSVQSDAYGLYMDNPTAAVTGMRVQYSPPIIWKGAAWKNTGSLNQTHIWRADVRTVNSTVLNTTSFWRLSVNRVSEGYFKVLEVASGNSNSGSGINVYGDSNAGFGFVNGVPIGSVGAGIYYGSPYPSTATGTPNTSIGASALANLTTGQYNTAVGHSALALDSSGSINTAVGYSSLNANRSGYSNTAVGVNSLLVNTTGFQNTSIGAGSGENNTTGQENTFVGYDAGLNNTTGIRNTYVGWNAKGSAKGIHNTHLGYLSGAGVLDSAANNTFIGESSGYHAAQKSDADNTIALGSDTYTTKNNQAVIGNNAVTETILRGALIDSTLGTGVGTKALRYNPTNGLITYADTTTGASGITVGTTTITSGTSTRVLFDDAAVVGEDGGMVYNKTTDQLTVGILYSNGDISNPDITFSSLGGVLRAKSIGTVQWYNPGISDAVHSWYKGDGSDGLTLTSTGMAFNTITGTGDFNIQTGAGELGIGSGTPTAKLHVFGTQLVTGAVQFSNYTAGTATFDGSGNITSVSDGRAKHNIKPFKYGLKEILKLKTSTFIYNQDKSNTVMSGFIAQDVQKVMPMAVHQKDGGMMSLETNAIIAALVEAVKEQQKQIKALRNEINSLKKK